MAAVIGVLGVVAVPGSLVVPGVILAVRLVRAQERCAAAPGRIAHRLDQTGPRGG